MKHLKGIVVALIGLNSGLMAQDFTKDDYMDATWMTTRFYGAQRSGIGPNWILDGNTHTTSFTSDSYNGKDVSGGWFDCGDHVFFGQPQSFAAYVLALSYATFDLGWHDLYTGDYTDYKASGNYTRAGGKANGVADLLEELRYEADFLVKAAPDAKTFIHQKGDGNYDHARWVTAGKMSTLTETLGGGDRLIIANVQDAYTPGMFSAMLAIMARVDPDETRRASYMQAAKNAYAFAKTKTGVGSSPGGFYDGTWWDGRWADGPFLGALELWLTTGDESYKTDAVEYWKKIEFNKGGYTRLAYANAVPISVILGQKYLDLDPTVTWLSDIGILENIYTTKNADGASTKETGGGGSFSVRTPAGGAFLYALYSKLNNKTEYDSYIYDQVDYLMGSNTNKKSYITGFSRGSAISPPAPHHRGYYGNENASKGENDVTPPTKNLQMGGVIAGSFNNGSHDTNVATWNINEVCVDLNAPLVGALGYVMSKQSPSNLPVNNSKIINVKNSFSLNQNDRMVFVSVENFSNSLSAKVINLEGKVLVNKKLESAQETLDLSSLSNGVYRVVLSDGKNIHSTKSLFFK